MSRSAVGKLRLVVPDNYRGRFDIEVSFVLMGSTQKQIRSASVAIEPVRETELKQPILFVSEESRTQNRSAYGIVPPKPKPKDRSQASIATKGAAEVKLSASPPMPERENIVPNVALGVLSAPRTGIQCDGIAQVQEDGTLIVTPYCQDGNLAEVARKHGMRTTAKAMRNNQSEKARVCRFIGDDIRARGACESYRNDTVRR